MGAPVENPFEVDMETLDLLLKIKPALASCGLLYPFPGTPVEEYAIKTGYMTAEQKGEYLDSNKRRSMFKFNSEKERKQVENLQKLASLIVDFPFLRPFVPFLTRLPLEGFYYFLFTLHMGYCYKVRLAPVKNLTREAQFWLGTILSLLRKTWLSRPPEGARPWSTNSYTDRRLMAKSFFKDTINSEEQADKGLIPPNFFFDAGY